MRNSSATEKKNLDVDAALPPRLPPATALSVPPHTPFPPIVLFITQTRPHHRHQLPEAPAGRARAAMGSPAP